MVSTPEGTTRFVRVTPLHGTDIIELAADNICSIIERPGGYTTVTMNNGEDFEVKETAAEIIGRDAADPPVPGSV